MIRDVSPLKLTRLSEFQATVVAFVLGGAATAALLVLLIGYRDTPLPLILFAGVAALVLAVVVTARPEIGTYVLVVFIFTNFSDVLTNLGLPSTNKPLVGLIAVSVLASFLFRQNRAHGVLIPPSATEWSMLAYGAVVMVSILYAENQGRALDAFTDFAKDFAILLCVVYSLKTLDSWKRAMLLIVFAVGVVALLGVYQVATGRIDQHFLGFAQVDTSAGDFDWRLSGPIGDPNFYAQVLAAALPLALYRMMGEKRLALRLIVAGVGLAIAVAILNTYSRGAFLGMVIVLALIAVERGIRFSYLVVVGLALVLLLAVVPAGYTERIRTILALNPVGEASVHADTSFVGRSSELQAGLLMFSDHPFGGVGAGNYRNHYQEYATRIGLEDRTEERQAHSLYVEVAAETGIPGIIAFGGMLVALFLGLFRAKRKLRRQMDTSSADWVASLQMSLTSYLITSLFLHGDYLRFFWLLVALSAAVMHIVHRLPPRDLSARTQAA